MEKLINISVARPLKYNFFKKDNDIYFLYRKNLLWLCEDFRVQFQRPNSKEKKGFEAATHAVLTAIKKVEGVICEPKFLKIDTIGEPLYRKKNGEITIPIEFLVHNKSVLYEFLDESCPITEDKNIRHQVRNYILNYEYVWLKHDIVSLNDKKNA